MANDDKIKKLKKELDDLKFDSKLLKDELKEAKKELNLKDEKLAETEVILEKKDEKLTEYISHLQRLQADFENFKKQSEKQKIDIVKFANEDLIINILDGYEDIKRALEKSKTEEELRKGVELIYSKLKNTLEKEGLKEIPTKDEKFDPFKHEALMAENSKDHEDGEIIEELMKGYTLKDKIIKYSKVKVCKK
jgi:molecular chaperone GrpE